jgi:hypothetical protein
MIFCVVRRSAADKYKIKMYRIDADDMRSVPGFVKQVLSLAWDLRDRRIVSWKYNKDCGCEKDCCCMESNGFLFDLDNGTLYTVLCEFAHVRNAIRFGVLKHPVGYHVPLIHELAVKEAFDHVGAIYWVASQQCWKDLAEDFLPYVTASIAAGGGDGSNETKKRKSN